MKKRISIIVLSFIFIMLIRILGLTYGFYAMIIKENTSDKSLVVESKYLSVVYTDGDATMNFLGDYFFPGDSAEKVFNVTNDGTGDATYNILIDNVINDFERTQDLRYELYINDELIDEGAINNNEVQYLYYNRSLALGATDIVKFVFTYQVTDEVQNMDMNKSLSFRFNIDSKLVTSVVSEKHYATFTSNVANLNNYRIYGNSIQNGTPTTSVPIAIQNVGDLVTDTTDENYGKYKIPVTVSGKNLANYQDMAEFVDGMQALGYPSNLTTFMTDDSGRELLALYSASGYGNENYEELRKIFSGIFKDNTQYTLSFDYYVEVDYQGMNLRINYTDGTYEVNDALNPIIDKVANQLYHYEHTTVANKTVSSIDLAYNSGYTYIYLDTLQLEEGVSGTSYEAFNGGTYNIYLDEPLRKVGNYVDYIDLRKQIVVRNVNVLDETGVYTIENSYTGLSSFITKDVFIPTLPSFEGTNNLFVTTAISPSKIEIEAN